MEGRVFSYAPLVSSGFRNTLTVDFQYQGKTYHPGQRYYWKVHPDLLQRVGKANRFHQTANNIYYIRYIDDFSVIELTDSWRDTSPGFQAQVYVVQTLPTVIDHRAAARAAAPRPRAPPAPALRAGPDGAGRGGGTRPRL